MSLPAFAYEDRVNLRRRGRHYLAEAMMDEAGTSVHDGAANNTVGDKIVTACVLIIGNEILSGRTQDENLAFLAKGLNDVGVRLREARVIPDVAETIVSTVNEARQKYDYVFTTGGIGPTHDDITSPCVAELKDLIRSQGGDPQEGVAEG